MPAAVHQTSAPKAIVATVLSPSSEKKAFSNAETTAAISSRIPLRTSASKPIASRRVPPPA